MTREEQKRYTSNLTSLLNFAWATQRPKFKTPQWCLEVHKCPRCNKAITDFVEYEFAKTVGECISCDHVRGDLE